MSALTSSSQAISDQQARVTAQSLERKRLSPSRCPRPAVGFDEVLVGTKKGGGPLMTGGDAMTMPSPQPMRPRLEPGTLEAREIGPHPTTKATSPIPEQQARAQRTQEDLEKQRQADEETKYGHGLDPLDPVTRQTAQLAGPTTQNPNPHDLAAQSLQTQQRSEEITPTTTRAKVSMEDLLPQLVKKIAWAGDRKKGTVQMELGAGRHAGTVVTVHADDGRVRVELDGHGPEVSALRDRIDARLKRQGIAVESVT